MAPLSYSYALLQAVNMVRAAVSRLKYYQAHRSEAHLFRREYKKEAEALLRSAAAVHATRSNRHHAQSAA